MSPVREEKYEKDESVPKVLCQMDNHLGKISFFIQKGNILTTVNRQRMQKTEINILSFICSR